MKTTELSRLRKTWTNEFLKMHVVQEA